ncbi:Hsp70 family protein [uncultured Cohaesibacter sp.]|uniref:Hsp70 family protein n=1 Tax=uncultured Cohaesibacter sp. TaxID=1002546 RepID=UPI0029C93B33|nr:Hsp70 family protein [uncultured Cohaesibacter sp.]
MSEQVCCGLDFGTSNSTLGLMNNGKPELVALEGDEVTIPSALFFDFEDHGIHFGRDAIDTYLEGGEGRMMRALKSILGTSTMQEFTMVGSERKPFTAVLGAFLRHMKSTAESQLQKELTKVVLGRPVFFVDNNPEADREAEETMRSIAGDLGFKDVEFEYEPVAAARDFQQQASREEIALIIDIGGGTSDFTILKVAPANHMPHAGNSRDQILANTGIHIGGTDFDRWLSLARVMPLMGYRSEMLKEGRLMPVGYYHDLATWQKINFLYDHKTHSELRYLRKEAKEPHLLDRLMHLLDLREGHKLALSVENSKVILSDQERTELSLSFVEKGLAAIMTRDDLIDALEDGTRRIRLTIAEALNEAGLSGEEITAVFLTGGSTKVPYIRESLTSMAPHATIIEGDAFGSVGIGLTLEAQKRFQ